VSKESFSMYSMLLKNELLGADTPYSSPAAAVDGKSPAPGNLLRFKSAERTTHVSPHRSFSLSPIISGDQNLLGSPKKFKRKIAKTPFKVLDAPALQDDFYLNLVDWSSLNVLAVGLGSCVYLWSACTSKVTKLCDFGNDDCVTSVSWTQRGTHLAVGTNLGEVQVRLIIIVLFCFVLFDSYGSVFFSFV
jgi:cell division cycle 20-like protein 1 (cofactor of APC complex)